VIAGCVTPHEAPPEGASPRLEDMLVNRFGVMVVPRVSATADREQAECRAVECAGTLAFSAVSHSAGAATLAENSKTVGWRWKTPTTLSTVIDDAQNTNSAAFSGADGNDRFVSSRRTNAASWNKLRRQPLERLRQPHHR
jgi:hypothetical protein